MIESSLHTEPVALPDGPTGKSARALVIYAVILAVISVTPFAVLLPVVLLRAGSRLGRRWAWLAAAIGLGFAGLYVAFTVSTGSAPRSEYAYFAAMLLALALPAMLVLPMVQRREPFGRVLLIALVVAVTGLLATEAASRALLSFSPYAEQLEGARRSAAAFADTYAKMGVPQAVSKKWMDLAVYCTPGFLVIDLAVFYLLSLIIYGKLHGWRDLDPENDGRDSPYFFRHLAFPDWLLFAFIAGGLSPLMKGVAQHIGANILAVVIFLYLVQGLSIFRALLVRFGAGLAASAAAWMGLGFLTVAGGIAPMLLSIAGLFDSFFDFRNITKRKDDSDESDFD
jgi:hypothetical protein